MWEREIPDMRKREIPDMWKREMEIPDMWEGELPDIMCKEILECGRRRYRASSCGRGIDGRRYRTSSSRGRKGMQVADRECVVDRLTPGGAPLQLLHDYRPLDSNALYYSGPPPVSLSPRGSHLNRFNSGIHWMTNWFNNSIPTLLPLQGGNNR